MNTRECPSGPQFSLHYPVNTWRPITGHYNTLHVTDFGYELVCSFILCTAFVKWSHEKRLRLYTVRISRSPIRDECVRILILAYVSRDKVVCRFQIQADIIPFTSVPAPGPTQTLSNGYRRLFAGRCRGRNVKLITHLHLLLKVKSERSFIYTFLWGMEFLQVWEFLSISQYLKIFQVNNGYFET